MDIDTNININININPNINDHSPTLKFNKILRYVHMISKLNYIHKQKEKVNHEYNLMKEKIDEFEANNLEYHDEFIKIKKKIM